MVGYAGHLAHRHKLLYGILVTLPVRKKHAWRAGHGQYVGIGSLDIRAHGVAGAGGIAVLRIVVFDKRDGVAPVVTIRSQSYARELAPVTAVAGIADGISGGEIKRSRLRLAVNHGAVDPVAQQCGVAIPILADRELGCNGRVVEARILGSIALGHVVTEAGITKLVFQETQVGNDIVLHILRRMVKVAHPAPVFARICRPGDVVQTGRSSAIIITANVGKTHLVCHAVVGLGREVNPRTAHTERATVVDNDIGNDANAAFAERRNHRAQLRLGSETAVLVVIVHRGVAHHVVGCVAVAALGHPNEVEKLGQFVGLRLDVAPLGVYKRVPVEPLQHHATIVGRPALCIQASRKEQHRSQKRIEYFHKRFCF